jgi:hypothetical protein
MQRHRTRDDQKQIPFGNDRLNRLQKNYGFVTLLENPTG